jgi:hypothetical protein
VPPSEALLPHGLVNEDVGCLSDGNGEKEGVGRGR